MKITYETIDTNEGKREQCIFSWRRPLATLGFETLCAHRNRAQDLMPCRYGGYYVDRTIKCPCEGEKE